MNETRQQIKPSGVNPIWRMIAMGLMLGMAARAFFSRAPVVPIEPPPLSVRGPELPAPDPRLKAVLDAVDFDHVKLSDALASLVARNGMNLVVRWDDLDKAAIEKTLPVSVHLSKVTFAAALDAVLFMADPKHVCCWNANDGIIDVTTIDAPNTQHLLVRLYDVRRLLKHASATSTLQSESESMDELKKYITDNIATTTWKDNGGDIGSISSSPLRGTMIVTQTAQAQEQIEAFLRTFDKNKK